MLKPPPPAAAQGMGYRKLESELDLELTAGTLMWTVGVPDGALLLCQLPALLSLSFLPPSFPLFLLHLSFFFSSITLYLCNMKHETKLYICSAGHSLHFFSNLKR